MIQEVEGVISAEEIAAVKTISPYCLALEEQRQSSTHYLKDVGDQWRTPELLFWGINALFGPLMLDLFADDSNAKCPAWFTAEDNALTQDWSARLQELGGAGFGNPPYSRSQYHEKQAIPTVTAGTSKRPGGNGHALGIVEAGLVPFLAGNGGSEYQAKPRPLDKPAHTILKESRACIVAPVIARQFGGSIGHRVDEPSATITAGGGGKSQLVVPTLIQMGYGERPGQAPRVPGLDKPLGTVVAGGGKHAVVGAFLAKHYGGNYQGAGVGLDEPAHSVTTVDHYALVMAQVVGVGGRAGQSRPRDVSEPLQTMTTKADAAIVSSHLVKLRGTCRDGQRADEPMPTITAGGQHVGEVKTTLAVEDYDEERAQQVLAFLREYCGEDSTGLVDIDGVTFRIVDIGMRMLQPHELYRAQGFSEWYIIDRDYRGVKYSKDKQVARCGNAVPPPFAEALVRANLPEMCVNKQERAA
ncbi:DNA N-6-adenine-methyltransferase [Raoultella ornithinolytica]|uniref:DNA N-6-adenine-methyltransferase n=1 Tax=Raoultella ornithinolytica TaxID=54291 RepID=UPI0039671E54